MTSPLTRDEAEARVATIDPVDALSGPHHPRDEGGPLVAAAAEVMTGAMVALIPTEADAQRLAVDGGEPAEELHCTLLYLGEAAEIPDEARQAIVDAVRSYVDGWPPVVADGFAVSMFNPPGVEREDGKQRDPCIVLGLSGDDLDHVHDMVGEAVYHVDADEQVEFTWPEQHAPWHAHVTLVYTDDVDMVAQLVDRVGPVTFDRVRVVFAGDATDIPLDAPHPDAVADESDDEGEPVAASATFQSRMPAQLQKYWLRRLAPWGHGSFRRCVRLLRSHYPKDPEGACANLHRVATGRWPGAGRDHADDGTQLGSEETTMTTPVPAGAFADDGADALDAPPADCPEGQHRDPDSGDCMPDEMTNGASVEHFHTVVMEGVSTGMREFAPDSITWRDPPFAYHWQYKSSAHGGMAETVQVGVVTRVERDGSMVHFWGRLDLASPEGMDYARRLVDGFAVWSSVGPDEKLTVELVYPEGDDGEGDALDQMFGEPEAVIYHDFRVAEVTAVSVPALADADVEPTQALRDALAEMGVLVAAAVGSHDTATSDASWDAAEHEARLDSPMSVATARKVYAWIDDARVEDDAVVKDACSFPHHEVSVDGEPGAANLTACSTGIGALHDGRSGTTIPDADRKGTYDHLAAHIRAGGGEPPEFDAGPLVAAGHVIEIPDVPPVSWFNEPTDVTPHGALTVTDAGRVYGYLAPSGIAHRSFPGQRVTAPMGRVDYDRWMGGEAIVAGGGRVVAGPITMECGHLPPSAASAADVRMEHYDNACSVVAKACVGENRHGVWIAGALEPGVSADQISRMLACRLSGDWAPHPERAGWREFVAALLVPVPGFPMTRSAPSVRVAEGALVASAVPVRLVHADTDVVAGADADLRPALERVARSIGRDAGTRLSVLRDRVRSGRG
jgi:2'-5' RNA ligase superfamily protein